MAYNFLNTAHKVSNDLSCVYDSSNAYITDFSINGNVGGWDVYYNTYFYGCWHNVLFGTSADRFCYIGRTDNMLPITAEDYYYVKIMLKITNNNKDKRNQGLTLGKLRWITLTDDLWDDKKEYEFDIVSDDQWHLYVINLGPARYWVGDICNLRVYPFIDGWEKDQFAIKYITISSEGNFKCSNTQCSYYQSYTHPCPGAGERGYCLAGTGYEQYTTISGNDTILVNIDGYGDAKFHLGENLNVTINEMAHILNTKLGSLSIGGYCYSSVEVEQGKLKILSGTTGINSAVSVAYSPAAVALGFFDSAFTDVSTCVNGVDFATGFDYASNRLLTATELGNLMDGNTDVISYTHNAQQYNVEGGRSDYNEIGYTSSTAYIQGDDGTTLANRGKTIVDWSHPFNSNGKIKHIYVYATRYANAKILICRPKLDGTLKVAYSLPFPAIVNNFYSNISFTHCIDCDILVNKGDLLAVFDADVSIGISLTNKPDATYSQLDGEPTDAFDPGVAYSMGVGGLAIYARSDKYQTNTLLDIDFGDRLNIEEFTIYGEEADDYFEYNIAMCLDVNWHVNLHGGNHKHQVWTATTSYVVTHTNMAYGLEALSDGKIIAENNIAGQSYTTGSTGLVTAGTHSYFYVNGDAEWLQPEEFSPTVVVSIYEFVEDPITLTLVFPTNKSCEIHKSIIYFKEEDNFRSFALYTGLGIYGYNGDYIDAQHKLIPSYNYIKMDGINYDSTNNEDIAAYLFSNPCSIDIVHDGDGYMVNTDNFFAANASYWTVLEHGFDPVDSYDFNIRCNYHNSTKITEIEVYSRMYFEPSIIDNVSLTYSTYGVEWKDALFSTEDTNVISAFIGGAPRYMKLSLQTATSFSVNELFCKTGDQVKTTKCDDTILLDDAKNGVVNDSKVYYIENLYDRPFDLMVDIPKTTNVDTSGIVFWSKLNSQEDIDNPDIGPPAVLRKAEDFILTNNNGQSAINTPCYGLNNLVDDKEAYYSFNEHDWFSYGTLISGTSINFDLGAYLNTQITEVAIPEVSATYWKLQFDSISKDCVVKDILAFYDDTRVPIELIYLNQTVDDAVMVDGVISNGVDINIPTIVTGNDPFDGIDGASYNTYLWQDNMLFDDSASYCHIVSNKLQLSLTTSEDGTYTLNYIPIIASDFSAEVSVTISFPSQADRLSVGLGVRGEHGGFVGIRKYIYGSSSRQYVFDKDAWYSYVNYVSNSILNFDLKITKVGALISCYYRTTGVSTWTTLSSGYSYTGFTNDRLKIELYTHMLLAFPNVVITFNNFNITATSILYPALIYSSNYAVGFKTISNAPINKIKVVHGTSTLQDPELLISYNNINYFTVGSALDYTAVTSNHSVYLAVDLLKRHNLDIIRNYGTLSDKLFLSSDLNVDYSNTTTDDVDEVAFGNSSKVDARWVRVNLLASDATLKTIDKLGIYPNIAIPYCIGGGYNCEWSSLGTILSDYSLPNNVAYNAYVEASNYVGHMTPDKVVDGKYNSGAAYDCWAFDGVNPSVAILFGDDYLIDKVRIHHSFSVNDSNFVNEDFTAYISTTVSGENFTQLFYTSNNTATETTHYFSPVTARRFRLVINSYTSTPISLGSDAYFTGSFLREIEIYTAVQTTYIDSETFPVICMNLKDNFNIVGHELISNDPNNEGISWDNRDEFFKYSESLYDDPKKVAFNLDNGATVIYHTDIDTGNLIGYWDYTFGDIYLDKGPYNVRWQSYDLDEDAEFGLRLEGPVTIDMSGRIIASDAWADEDVLIEVSESGYYTLKGIAFISNTYNWAIRNISIYRTSEYARWISVRRNTATEYAYNDITSEEGVDTLSVIKVYSEGSYAPTAYSWWWSSTVSVLSNDTQFVKDSNRSLKIAYPASTAEDTVMFIPGDDFGIDDGWSIKDLFTFQLYISDINKIDASFGDITFGIVNAAQENYYRWSLNDITLVTGWNHIRLKFEDFTTVYPLNDNSFYNLINQDLNFIYAEEGFNYVSLRYKGVGQAVTLYLTSLKIERNKFYDTVKFDKGLYLNNRDFLQIPVSGLTLTKGTIEFWLKTYYDSYGLDIFDRMQSRTLFSIVNNSNNIVSLGVKAGHWLELAAGHIRRSINLVNADSSFALSGYFDIDSLIHVAVVWDNSGTNTDNNDTIRLYINNVLIYNGKTTWEINDTKDLIVRLAGGNTPLAYNYDSPSGGGVYENIKLYNYCKTDFDINKQDISTDMAYDPNDYMEISSDNITFYNVGSAELPIIFNQVPAGDKRAIYIRANKTKGNFNNSGKTGQLLISWLTTV
jgi:hypothetical protein